MSRADFERMTDGDFWEEGASGRRYRRGSVLEKLDKRHTAPREDLWDVSGFACRKLADDRYLATYTLTQDGNRMTRRATIWQRTEDGWKALHHQEPSFGGVVGGL